jgi:hypothetical protein
MGPFASNGELPLYSKVGGLPMQRRRFFLFRLT